MPSIANQVISTPHLATTKKVICTPHWRMNNFLTNFEILCSIMFNGEIPIMNEDGITQSHFVDFLNCQSHDPLEHDLIHVVLILQIKLHSISSLMNISQI